MNVRSILFSISLLIGYVSQSQTYSFEWVAPAGATGSETSSFRSAVDASGNVYNIGVFDSITDVDPGPGTYLLYSGHDNTSDIYIRKLDAAGNLVWAFQLGDPEYQDNITTINVDPSGNIIISGFFTDTLDLDPTAGVTNVIASPVNADIYIAKYTPSGTLLWAKQTEGSVASGIIPLTSKLDPMGNIYLTGQFADTIDVDTGPGISTINSVNQSVFVIKFDNSGNLIWAKAVGVSSCSFCDSWATALCLDQSGSILLTGLYRGTCDFDPGVGISNLSWPGTDYQIFICKLDPLGNLIWAEAIGNRVSIYDLTADIIADASGNFYITGCYDTIADMDPGPGVTNLAFSGTIHNDIFICKFKPSGDLIWARGIGGTGIDIPGTLVLDHSRIILSGFFQYTMDFDPGPGSTFISPGGFYDSFILSLDTSSAFINALHLKSDPVAYNYGRTLIRDISGNLYFTGGFDDGFVDFDPGPLTHNIYAQGILENVFVLKLHASFMDIVENEIGAISVFPNPGNTGFSFTAFTKIDKIEIRNVLGQIVYSESNPSMDFVNMTSFSDGLYTLFVFV
ncbi:MAG: T9SS type A sorting domain-containing protein [Bacteroidetes bacterium]|nr:T9SS type A sorting domain-containing protein [Bacteroidota bacterium]